MSHYTSGYDWCWFPTRCAIYLRDGKKCLACGRKRNLTLDRIQPRCRGGSNRPENLITLCLSCNSQRRAVPLNRWRPGLAAIARSAARKVLPRAEGRAMAERLRPGRLAAKRERDAKRWRQPEGVPF